MNINHEPLDDIGENTELRIVVLVENTSCSENITPEHGLAVYIEYDGKRGLYDTGQTDVILENAFASFINLEDLDWLALSHGHYDHTGGLLPVLKESDHSVPVYAGKGLFNEKYALRDEDVIEPIGIPYSKDVIANAAASFTEVGEFTEISKDIYLIGPAPLIESYEAPSQYMRIKDKQGQYTNDLMLDERTLVIDGSDGLIVITGCAHRGAINIINHTKKLFPNKSISLVLGGFHLGKTDIDVVMKKIEALKASDIGGIGLCHCTGAKASRIFLNEMPDICFIAPAGSEIML